MLNSLQLGRALFKSHFGEKDKTKISLVVFGVGLKLISQEKFKEKCVGVSESVYKHLKRKGKRQIPI